MKIYPDTKIYMACPGNMHSGGPELCHQFASQTIQFGLNVSMYYLPLGENFNTENPVDSFYEKYHLPYVRSIEDHPHNVLVINECSTLSYRFFKNLRIVIWWMSVDNYVKNIAKILLKHSKNPLISPMPQFFYFEKDIAEHWVQSEYARQFLLLNGISKKQIYFVEDYLNQAFLSNADKIELDKKKDIVTFNPLKGAEITQQLMEIAPDIKWIAIENMTPSEVQALLARAKVYIDFGNHPGKDRIPREAALSGCVVITGKRGAAANDIDINIPAEFKFDETDTELSKVVDKILDVFKNFDKNYKKQQDYRTRILDDKSRFAKEVAAAFNLKSPKLEFSAVAQGLSENGVNLVETLCLNNLTPDFIIDDTFANIKNMPDSDLIKTIYNEKYFFHPNVKTNGILIISEDDAKFLYLEGRLNKFILLNPADAEVNSVAETYNAAQEDILSVNFN